MDNIENTTTEKISELSLDELHERVHAGAERVAELGNWPAWMKPNAANSLTSRVPKADKAAPGFDAGVACTLGLIPEDKQELSAALHGAYTPEKIAQVRKEVHEMDPHSETAWWLAACKLCEENEPVDGEKFKEQLNKFEGLAADPKARLQAANSAYTEKMTSFGTEKYGVPYGTIDGCLQGAYIAGYPFATQWSDRYGIFFIGTPFESLGLEDSEWEDPDRPEDDHQGNSGPVFGNRQYIKCANEAEFQRALEVIKKKFPDYNQPKQ